MAILILSNVCRPADNDHQHYSASLDKLWASTTLAGEVHDSPVASTTHHPALPPALRLLLEEVEVAAPRHHRTHSDLLHLGDVQRLRLDGTRRQRGRIEVVRRLRLLRLRRQRPGADGGGCRSALTRDRSAKSCRARTRYRDWRFRRGVEDRDSFGPRRRSMS